jgi:hypothetical protein
MSTLQQNQTENLDHNIISQSANESIRNWNQQIEQNVRYL